MYHYRKKAKVYNGYPKQQTCDFCDLAQMQGRAVHETKHVWVVPNRTFYDIWELHTVTDHLLVIPKHHVHSLSELSDTELLDVMKICAEYEGREYNVYARATGSVRRTVHHQHTHLIKINSKSPRFSLYLRKPYLLIKF